MQSLTCNAISEHGAWHINQRCLQNVGQKYSPRYQKSIYWWNKIWITYELNSNWCQKCQEKVQGVTCWNGFFEVAQFDCLYQFCTNIFIRIMSMIINLFIRSNTQSWIYESWINFMKFAVYFDQLKSFFENQNRQKRT